MIVYSDFHLSSIIEEDRKGNVCREEAVDLLENLDKMRAPEELIYKALSSEDDKRPDLYIHRDKADVWALGNLLYNTLTKQWVYEGIPNKEARKKIKAGIYSDIPSEFLESKDPYDQAMVKAIQMAYTVNPDERPSAREIANYLKRKIGQSKRDPIWKITIPKLPADYSRTESDFANNLKE